MLTALVIGTIVLGFGAFAFPRRAADAVRLYGVAVAFAGLVVLEFVTPPWAGNVDERARWLSYPFTANYHLGLGGISFAIVQTLAVVTICALLVTRAPRQNGFVAWVLVLEGTMLGLFLARDLLLFALLWDAMLIPVFLLMVGWSRQPATAWRYLIYNVAGGLFLLLATAGYGIIYGSTDVIGQGAVAPLSDEWAPWILGGFALAFLVKTPVWPLHTWMPDTYADLPSPVAAIVSAIQSKAGLYGFIVIGLPLFIDQMHRFAPLMFVLAFVGLMYGAFIALTQTDAKRVVAYSSLSHLGLILAAIFTFNAIALRGAVVYIVAHALFSAALFLVIGYVETREETRLLPRIGGLARRSPILAGAMGFAALAALGLPGLGGFSGELFILVGLYQSGFFWLAVLAMIAIVVASAYMLRVYQGFMHGPEQADLPQRPDLGPVEIVALVPLFLGLLLLGINPGAIARYPDRAYSLVTTVSLNEPPPR
ncbi:MAG: NADH-quinone oxidoreductase subunit M [Candidatus Eremiobacteraeota bacterium]|nr:NADH-quinone oxidoreductase subunit M [Candidatus Eremiobacteraeota bacterium]MBV8354119.1 NADH-quinone oxidoreductase subunit M [Candidatus Eremiobacteraeota bacterium]